MKYAIDQIVDDVALLENIETGEKKYVSVNELPLNVKEGSVVVYNIGYQLDEITYNNRKERIRAKLERLKGLK